MDNLTWLLPESGGFKITLDYEAQDSIDRNHLLKIAKGTETHEETAYVSPSIKVGRHNVFFLVCAYVWLFIESWQKLSSTT